MAVNLPVKPTIRDLVAPEYFTLNIPTLDTIDLPTLDVPVFDNQQTLPGSPATSFVYAAYGSTIQDALDQQITDYFAFTYDRWVLFGAFTIARRPLAQQFSEYTDKAFEGESARGFIFPTGAFRREFETRELLYREALQDKALDISNDAFETFKGIHEFSLKASSTREEIAINSHNKIQASTLKYATLVADISIEGYTSWYKQFQAKAEALKVYVQSWELTAKAQLVLLDEFEAHTNFAMAELDKDSALIQLYIAHIEFLKATASVQELEYDSATAVLLVEQAQLEQYLAEISSYTANIQKNTAEFEKYSAEIDLALVDFEKWKAQASIADAEIDVARARVSANSQVADSNMRIKRMRADELRNVLRLARMSLQSALDRIRAYEAEYKVDLTQYRQGLEEFLALEDRRYMEYEREVKLELVDYNSDETITNRVFATKTDVDGSTAKSRRISNYGYDRTITQAELAARSKLTSTLVHTIVGG